MPQSHSHSSRKTPKNGAKQNRANLMAYLEATSGKGASRSGEKSKGATLGHLNRKRKSSSSVSSVSSLSSMSDLSDEEDGSEDADDEDDTSPSYDVHKNKGYKAGSKSSSARKKVKLSDDDGYEGQQSNVESDSESSDDDYAAVDEIMDADDEDQELEKLEEQLIVESEDEHNIGGILSFSNNTVPDEWAGLGSLDNHMLFSTASLLDEEQIYTALETFGETDVASEAIETPVQRRVHFQEDSDSSSDSEASDDEIPGDFLQQDSLDPDLRRMIENDHFGNQGQRSDDIFAEYDIGQGNIYHVESDAVSEESSGYETDDGETTDEDLPPPATITHPRSILRRDSSVSLTAPDDTAAQRSQPPRRRGPIMGSFVPDPHKPVALVDCTGKHLVIIPAYASSRHDWLESATNSLCGTANNSPRATTLQLVDESDTDALASPSRPDLSPMLTSSANLMMTALGNDATPGGQVMGPPEAFYPSRDFGMDSSYDEEEDDDDEAALNVDDFIDFGNGSSDEETDRPFEDEGLTSPMVASSVQGAGTPTPNRNGDAHQGSSAERFLNHLDRGIVTAFRRNHNRYQTLIRLPQHREFMPANSPSRPASVFRHSRHMDPKTPSRKRKSSNYAGGEAVRRKLMDAHRRTQLPF